MKGKIELKSGRENKSSCPGNFFNQQSAFSRLSFNVTKLARFFFFTQVHKVTASSYFIKVQNRISFERNEENYTGKRGCQDGIKVFRNI